MTTKKPTARKSRTLTAKLKEEARLMKEREEIANKAKEQAKEKKTRVLYDLESLRWYETRKVGPQKYERDFGIHKKHTQQKLKESERWKESSETKLLKMLLKEKKPASLQELCRTFSWLAVPHSKERTIANLNDLLLSTLTALQEIGEYEVAIIAKNNYEKLAWLNYTPKDKRPKTQRSLSAFLKNQRDSGKLKVASGGEAATQITLDDIIESLKEE